MNKESKIVEQEKEVFVTFNINSLGTIEGHEGVDEEWFFSNSQDLTSKKAGEKSEDGKSMIDEIFICALDFMLPQAVEWINKGS